jgi:hypothetical protein
MDDGSDPSQRSTSGGRRSAASRGRLSRVTVGAGHAGPPSDSATRQAGWPRGENRPTRRHLPQHGVPPAAAASMLRNHRSARAAPRGGGVHDPLILRCSASRPDRVEAAWRGWRPGPETVRRASADSPARAPSGTEMRIGRRSYDDAAVRSSLRLRTRQEGVPPRFAGLPGSLPARRTQLCRVPRRAPRSQATEGRT